MKVLYTVILFLLGMSAYSQMNQTNTTNGMYIFQKATFTTYNSDTKAEVEVNTIDDPTIAGADKVFYAQNLFLEANIYNGELDYCKLFDGSMYSVRFATELSFMKNTVQENPEQIYQTLMFYTLSIDEKGNTLTFTTKIPFGNTKYNFPLEGKLVLTMTKQ